MDAKESLLQFLVSEGYLKTPRIVEAFRAIDRADFVLPEYRNEAYGNYPLPIGKDQTISQPLTVAFMLELLDPQPGEKILDVGAGSGWTTTLLTHIVGKKGRVFGMERVGELCEFGRKNLAKYFSEAQAKIICGDGTKGLPEEAPFDKILAGAAASRKIPETWRKQLKVGGKIVAPVEVSIWVFEKKPASASSYGEAQWEEIEYPGFAFVPLIKDTDRHGQTRTDSVYSSSEAPADAGAKSRRYLKVSPRQARTILPIFLAFILGIMVVANEIYRPHISYKNAKSVEVTPGLGARKIAEVLKKEGVVRSKWAFVTYVSLKGFAYNLKPGNYVFGRVAIPEIVRDLARGGTNERAITIPEGWNLQKIAEYLGREGVVSLNEFLTYTNQSGQHPVLTRFNFLSDRPKNEGLEGYLFPDTYRIFKDAKPEDVLVKMLDNFGRKLTPELRAEIVKQQKSIFEIVTMASLVEKEVVSDEDRSIVSGILWKRLEMGIGLQVDATVAYITGKNTTKISREETQIDSPYNTYKYRGLPKGPISNPGLSALRAGTYPKESPYLYYLSTPDGRTLFSKTLEEHNEAKAKFLK